MRFYFSSNVYNTNTPAYSAAWDDVTPSGGLDPRKQFPTVKAGSGGLQSSLVGFNSGQKALAFQFTSEDLGAGMVITTGVASFKCQVRARQENSDDNVRTVMAVKIVSADGNTVRATLLAVQQTTSTTFATSPTTRNKSWSNSFTSEATYTTVTGDRLVVEIGFTDAAGTTPEGRVETGGDSFSDAGENETDTANIQGWFELNGTTIDPGGIVSAIMNSEGGWF